MGAVGSEGDALQVLLTGAASAGAAVLDPALSLGGYRSGVRAQLLQVEQLAGLLGLEVLYASGANGKGLGTLSADSDGSVMWTAPGGGMGAAVAIANGETKVVPGDTASAFAVVRRTAAVAPVGSVTVQLRRVLNNVIGGANFTAADTTAGAAKYRAPALFNASAGAITDVKIWQDAGNSGVQIALETPASDQIQTVPDEDTAPAGVSWNSGTTEGTGLSVASLAAGDWRGLWIEKAVSAGASADALALVLLHLKYTAGAVTYQQVLPGLYHQAEAGIALFGLWIGVGTDPGPRPWASGPPDETYAAEPYVMSTVLPVSTQWYLRKAERNQWGLWGGARLIGTPERDGGGTVIDARPAGPAVVNLFPAPAGQVVVSALYTPNAEGFSEAEIAANRATHWVVYARFDGTDPDPSVDSPVATPAMGGGAAAADLEAFGQPARLGYTLAGQLDGTPVRVLVRTRRSTDGGATGVDSENVTASATTATWLGPAAPAGRAAQGEARGYTTAQTAPVPSTEVIDAGCGLEIRLAVGSSALYVGSTLIWRSLNRVLYVPRTWDLDTVTGVGAGGSSDALDVVTACTLFGANVNGTRVAEIDVANADIRFGSLNTANAVDDVTAAAGTWQQYDKTRFQYWDGDTGRWRTGFWFHANGELRTPEINNVLTQAEIEAL